MKIDVLGTRMKLYEQYNNDRFMHLLPICARLDGKGFSKFTKGLKRPYDVNMSELMQAVTQYLVEETQACIGYTQSDEISLVWYSGDIKKQVFFDGKRQKMISILAAMASAKFNKLIPSLLPAKIDEMPLFDCRVWQTPTKEEAVNAILWREQDATKNSISMAASEYYSHNQLHKCNGNQKIEMLFQKGIQWNNYPTMFKRGTYYQRSLQSVKFTASEIDRLPKQHAARSDPNLTVVRSIVQMLPMPPLATVINRVEVIFNGEQPKTNMDR